MIKEFLLFIVIFSIMFLNSLGANENCFAMSYLKGEGISFEGTRLNGELKNAPVKNILKELMENEGFACQVTGDLQGTTSLSIDNLTVEETIRKIMRNLKYNYTMILVEPESTIGSHTAVSELSIYQSDKVVQFVKVPKGSPVVQPKRVQPVSTPVAPFSTEKPVRTKVATGEELAQLDREIKSFMDEMLTEEKMSQQEYDEVLQTFPKGENNEK